MVSAVKTIPRAMEVVRTYSICNANNAGDVIDLTLTLILPPEHHLNTVHAVFEEIS